MTVELPAALKSDAAEGGLGAHVLRRTCERAVERGAMDERPSRDSATPLPVAACWWALTRVASSITDSFLRSLVSSAKTRSQTPET